MESSTPAEDPQGRSKVQALSGYAASGVGFNDYLGALRSRDLIKGDGQSLTITRPESIALDSWEPLPSAVRGPKYVIKKGKTPVLTPEEARLLLDSIDVSDNSGLRDRALLAVMVYSLARVLAVVGMNVEDYYQQGKRWWLRLHEKGGKYHELMDEDVRRCGESSAQRRRDRSVDFAPGSCCDTNPFHGEEFRGTKNPPRKNAEGRVERSGGCGNKRWRR